MKIFFDKHSQLHVFLLTIGVGIAVLCGVLWSSPPPVRAQDVILGDSPMPTATQPETASSAAAPVEEMPMDPLPFQTPSPASAKLDALRERYKTELTIYRSDERAHELAVSQYVQLRTLVSIETAVKATQKVLSSRNDVLQTYLEMLVIVVEDTPGIDITEKSTLLTELRQAFEQIEQYEEQSVKIAVDRNKVAEAVTAFVPLSESVPNVAYKALSYVAYGRIQSVFDKLLVVRDEVSANLEEREQNGLRLGEKRRAMNEINSNIEDTRERIVNIRASLRGNPNRQKVEYGQGSYGQTVNDLGLVYAEIFRSIEFLREVLKP
jgi:hypothetical protein